MSDGYGYDPSNLGNLALNELKHVAIGTAAGIGVAIPTIYAIDYESFQRQMERYGEQAIWNDIGIVATLAGGISGSISAVLHRVFLRSKPAQEQIKLAPWITTAATALSLGVLALGAYYRDIDEPITTGWTVLTLLPPALTSHLVLTTLSHWDR